jgi:hypothetical protein
VRRKESPDEVRYHAAACCPDCGRKLEGGWEHRRRQTIEVVLQMRVVDHVVVGRWCGVCQKRVLARLETSEIGGQGKGRPSVAASCVPCDSAASTNPTQPPRLVLSLTRATDRGARIRFLIERTLLG